MAHLIDKDPSSLFSGMTLGNVARDAQQSLRLAVRSHDRRNGNVPPTEMAFGSRRVAFESRRLACLGESDSVIDLVAFARAPEFGPRAHGEIRKVVDLHRAHATCAHEFQPAIQV